MSTFTRRRNTLRKMAEYAKYRLWRGDESEFVAGELAALLWVLAILDELKERGLYEDVAKAASDRFVELTNMEVRDGRTHGTEGSARS